LSWKQEQGSIPIALIIPAPHQSKPILFPGPVTQLIGKSHIISPVGQIQIEANYEY
jgi:hypothetical protein